MDKRRHVSVPIKQIVDAMEAASDEWHWYPRGVLHVVHTSGQGTPPAG